MASITIDPNKEDNLEAAEKILASIRISDVVIYGWTSYAVGENGLYVDLPKPPSQPKKQNAVTIYDVESPLSYVRSVN